MARSLSMSKYRLVTFDATNTLIKLKNPVANEYIKVAQIYCDKIVLKTNSNRSNCEKDLTKAFKTVWKEMNEKHKNFGLNDGMSSLDWWSQTVKKTFRLADYSQSLISDRQLDLISKHLFRHYSSANCWAANPKSHKVLTTLKQRDSTLKIGVISNNDERLERILHELGLRHHFDVVVISRLVKHCKPSKEIFDCCLSGANISDPSLALHIGNDIDFDYIPAKSFGWNAVLYADVSDLTARHLSTIDANDCISDLDQLIDKCFRVVSAN